jgi:hypothetical protein
MSIFQLLIAALLCPAAAQILLYRGTTPPNTADPSYIFPAARGGKINMPGNVGMLVDKRQT